MRVVCLLLQAYQLVILVHVIGSWVPEPPDALRGILRGAAGLVDPVLQPLRRVIPPARIGNALLDTSLLVLILALFLLQAVLC